MEGSHTEFIHRIQNVHVDEEAVKDDDTIRLLQKQIQEREYKIHELQEKKAKRKAAKQQEQQQQYVDQLAIIADKKQKLEEEEQIIVASLESLRNEIMEEEQMSKKTKVEPKPELIKTVIKTEIKTVKRPSRPSLKTCFFEDTLLHHPRGRINQYALFKCNDAKIYLTDSNGQIMDKGKTFDTLNCFTKFNYQEDNKTREKQRGLNANAWVEVKFFDRKDTKWHACHEADMTFVP